MPVHISGIWRKQQYKVNVNVGTSIYINRCVDVCGSMNCERVLVLALVSLWSSWYPGTEAVDGELVCAVLHVVKEGQLP